MNSRLCAAAVIVIAMVASSARATEVRIRIPRPANDRQAVQLKKAQLLLAWWGHTEVVPLTHRYEGNELVVTVPLDRDVWTSLKAPQPPDFGYVYLQFNDFVSVRSDKFYWLDGIAPAPSPMNWETVNAVHFGFRGGAPTEVRSGEQREQTLTVRRPVRKQLRLIDDLGLPFTDLAVDGGMFWSNANHCGVAAGLDPLFTNNRPNSAGIVAIPDGDVEFGFQIRRVPHVSVVEPSPEYGLFFITYIDGPELLVRLHRHVKTPLSLRVTRGGIPASGVIVAAAVPARCGSGMGTLGRTDDSGVLSVPDFYPEEFEALCIAGSDGHPRWAIRPGDDGDITVELPESADIGEPEYCYLR